VQDGTVYTNDIDYFGVYCPENDKVYLVPVEDTTQRLCSLRVTPAKNNQKKRVRWAKDYEVVALMAAGEAAGQIPSKG
jgi:hypothetical protein